jgi:hypothetical protein
VQCNNAVKQSKKEKNRRVEVSIRMTGMWIRSQQAVINILGGKVW